MKPLLLLLVLLAVSVVFPPMWLVTGVVLMFIIDDEGVSL